MFDISQKLVAECRPQLASPEPLIFTVNLFANNQSASANDHPSVRLPVPPSLSLPHPFRPFHNAGRFSHSSNPWAAVGEGHGVHAAAEDMQCRRHSGQQVHVYNRESDIRIGCTRKEMGR